ncbi:MAG TPA: nitrilase-related carbon-nitrogen hydrolase [Bacteroidales bacterium]|nr:nitrilase-related carbon-nitrogen hydrolase [Bacteroidales bacterium]HRZ48185.1 nitrilase-related carbon-nitrogen hydrolase [Bacteroidales bacterium]
MTHDLRIALLQAELEWENKEVNLARFARMFGSLASQPDLVLLPEVFNTAFSMNPEHLAETMDGPTVEWMVTHAAEYQCVVAGTLMIRVRDAYVNRLIWVFPDGDLGFYDKRHLFRPGGEAGCFMPGKERRAFTVKGWRILPLTCYDLRFPVWSMNRYLEETYEFDVLCYHANWPATRTFHWRSLLMARAIENQAYVAAVNRTGTDGNGISHSGNSMVISPFGEIFADAGDASESVLEYSLSYEEMMHYRKKFFIAPDWDLSANQHNP